MSSSEPSKETPSITFTTFGSRKQQLAAHISQTLGRVTPQELLNDTNYHSWSSEVRNGLSSLYYDGYFASDVDDVKTDQVTRETNEVIRKGLVAWLLRQMDHTNRLRFEPVITEYTSKGPATRNLPSSLWKAIDHHYASRSEETKFILSKVLDSTSQSQSTTISDHLITFQAAVTNLRLAGGLISDVDLGRKLLASLHLDHMSDAREILIKGVTSYPDVVNELRRRINTDLMLGKRSVTIEANAAGKRRQKCTAKKCVGTKHTPSECFRKPGNEHLMQAWVAERQKLGLWRDQPPSSSISTLTSSQTPPSPTIQALQASFEAMTISPQCHHTHSSLPDSSNSEANSATANSQAFTALIDTGATHHMIRDLDAFDPSSYSDISNRGETLDLADGSSTLPIVGTGSVTFTGPNKTLFKLENCLHVPGLRHSLIGGTKLLRLGFVTSMTSPSTFQVAKAGQVAFEGSLTESSNLLTVKVRPINLPSTSIARACTDNAMLLHRRLGHPNPRYLNDTVNRGTVGGDKGHKIIIPSSLPCNACDLSKGHKIPHSHTRTRAAHPLDNIHLDLSGIIRTSALCGSTYYILFTDDHTSYRHVSGMPSKNAEAVFEKITQYIALVERQCDRHVKRFTLDNGSEFFNHLLVPYCTSKGIILRPTAPYTPEENGVAERSNRTVVSKARAMMIEANMPIRFWLHAVKTAIYLMNRTVSSTLESGVTPYEMWHGSKPDISHIRVFGCLCSILTRKEIRQGKFAPVSKSAILIGYAEQNRNYIVFIPENNTILTSHDVTFREDTFPFHRLKSFDISHLSAADDNPASLTYTNNTTDSSMTPSHHTPDDFLLPDPIHTTPDTDLPPPQDQPPDLHHNPLDNPPDDADNPPARNPLPRRSSRERRPTDRYRPAASPAFWHDDHSFISPASGQAYAYATTPTVRLLQEPHNYRSAMSSQDHVHWTAACEKEMANLREKAVWTLTPRPLDHPVVGGRWHFRIKTLPDGSISKYKARYVAKGYTQTYGVDYQDTFAPTGKPASYRTLVALAATHGFEIHQMDAVAAFLNSDLREVIYIEQPEGFEEEGKEDWVCLLNKALYGLKQSAKEWNDEFRGKCVKAGFHQSPADECIYIRDRGPSDICVFYLHVDDLAITGNNIPAFKTEISSFWPMEDLGVAHCVVGIQTARISQHHYAIGQQAMTISLLARFGMTTCKQASTPLPGGAKLTLSTPDEAIAFAKRDMPYRSGVGSLMYLAQCTRPDISYAVGVLSQHLENPCDRHWAALEHVLRYLKGTSTAVINYHATSTPSISGNQSWHHPACFSDADWAGDKSTRRSTTGYLFTLAGGAVSWRSRLQQTVALSSTEAEYRATTEAGQEIVWLNLLLSSLNISPSKPTLLHCDNLSTIDLAEHAIFHGRTKHIEIHHHWIREKINDGTLELTHCESSKMVADILTKPLHPGPFNTLRSLTGLSLSPNP